MPPPSVLLAHRGGERAELIPIPDFVERFRARTIPCFAMLTALRRDEPVVFPYEGRQFIVTRDNPRFYSALFDGLFPDAIEVDRVPIRVPGDHPGPNLRVWRIPVSYSIGTSGHLTVAAKTLDDAEEVIQKEMARIARITDERAVRNDPFYRVVDNVIENEVRQIGWDLEAEIEGDQINIDEERVKTAPDGAEPALPWPRDDEEED